MMDNTEKSQETTDKEPRETSNTYDQDIEKYTKIDNLDEDQVVDSSKYFLVSFISPEGVMNCTTRGLKIRTYKNKVCFGSLEEAKQAADEINKKDKYFNVFVGETGKWMGWDHAPDDRTKVEEEKWANPDQDALMQKMREKEEKQLNELNALVGKKKDIINKEKKTHKKRVAEAIKTDATENKQEVSVVGEEEVEQEQEQEQEQEVKQTKMKKTSRNPMVIREKLRKKLQEKKLNDPNVESNVNTSEILKERVEETITQETKLEENIKKLTDLLNKAKTK